MKRSFTLLCRQVAGLAAPRRADLHVHTTASDGEYTPSQVVALARRANLAAVAVTDHDTLAGVPEAAAAARQFENPAIEVVPGVEITTEFDGRELHLLALFVRTDHAELTAALGRLCERRRERFFDYARLLDLPTDRAELAVAGCPSPGRRHVAGLLVACGVARNRHEAFHRHLGRLRGKVVPKEKLPIADAIALAHAAGGVASLAHPPPDLDDAAFDRLRAAGLDAVEAAYPWGRSGQGTRLRAVADRFGFLVTGGSDCHGPDPAHRGIGAASVGPDELDRLRGRAGCAVNGEPAA
jgi:predicted metal-dependent phosphoesterase TrpH